MRRAGAAMVACAALAAGCGDPALWERYQAERDLFRANQLLERVELEHGADTVAAGRAQRAFAGIVRRYPAERRDAMPEGARLDVAVVVGRAGMALARIDEIRGDDDAAARAYAEVADAHGAVSGMALEASLAAARALERAGRPRDAAAAWREIPLRFSPVDGETERARAGVLEAPLAAARCWAAAGDSAAGDRVLAESEPGLARALAEWERTAAGGALRGALAAVQARGGDANAALATLRPALAGANEPATRTRILIDLAECGLRGGAPESALVYAGWAERSGGAGTEASLRVAESWEGLGEPDSALRAYGRAVDGARAGTQEEALARFRRGALLQRIGRWEQARSEYRTLAAGQAGQPLALAALRLIVQHHAAVGEHDLARFEAKRALEDIELWRSTQAAAEADARLRRGKAEILSDLGDWDGAFAELADLWQRHPRTESGAWAGLDAAGIAEQRLLDPGRAAGLYREAAERGRWQAIRDRARAELERLAEHR